MESVEESIRALSQAVTQRVREDADQVLSDAQAHADELREEARQQAEAERKRILRQATREAERIVSQAVASAQLEGRKQMLERREKLLDAVFEAAHKRLPAIQQWTDYRQIVDRLASEAVAQLRAERCVIRADTTTQTVLSGGLLDDLQQALGVRLDAGAALEDAIGILAETPDGHRQYDNTLGARMGRLEEELRFPVYRLLRGESL